jgi:hypothetical protein
MVSTNNFDQTSPISTFASQADKKRESASDSSASGSKTGKSQFGVDFQPSNFSVVCGRGINGLNHVGNRRFRVIASMAVDRYSLAGDRKRAKSDIVSEIIAVIRKAGGNFARSKKVHGSKLEMTTLAKR